MLIIQCSTRLNIIFIDVCKTGGLAVDYTYSLGETNKEPPI